MGAALSDAMAAEITPCTICLTCAQVLSAMGVAIFADLLQPIMHGVMHLMVHRLAQLGGSIAGHRRHIVID